MIRYDRAGSTCAAGDQPGTQKLLQLLLDRYPGTRSSGIHNCRNVGGSKALSLHGEGRAVDIRPASRAQGDAIAAWALANASALNIQEIIWYRRIWSAVYPNKGWRDYHGVNPHVDHVHIGQNWLGAGGSPGGGTNTSKGTSEGISGVGWLILLTGAVGIYLAYQDSTEESRTEKD